MKNCLRLCCNHDSQRGCVQNTITTGKTLGTSNFAVSNDLLQHWHKIAHISLIFLRGLLTIVYSSCQLASLQPSSQSTLLTILAFRSDMFHDTFSESGCRYLSSWSQLLFKFIVSATGITVERTHNSSPRCGLKWTKRAWKRYLRLQQSRNCGGVIAINLSILPGSSLDYLQGRIGPQQLMLIVIGMVEIQNGAHDLSQNILVSISNKS